MFYGLKALQSLRIATIARDGGRCRRCGVRVTSGRKSKRSAAVDHIKPHKGDKALFFDPDNVWTLCKGCHDGWKAQVEGRKRSAKRMQRDDGWSPVPILGPDKAFRRYRDGVE